MKKVKNMNLPYPGQVMKKIFGTTRYDPVNYLSFVSTELLRRIVLNIDIKHPFHLLRLNDNPLLDSCTIHSRL